MNLLNLKKSLVFVIFWCMDILNAVDDDLILQTNELPAPNLMPILGNGNLGFRVFSDSIYANYLFNGERVASQRARLPNYSNLQFQYCNEKETNDDCTFYLNLKDGIFYVRYTKIDYIIEQKIYPHRFYVNTIVNEIMIDIIGLSELKFIYI